MFFCQFAWRRESQCQSKKADPDIWTIESNFALWVTWWLCPLSINLYNRLLRKPGTTSFLVTSIIWTVKLFRYWSVYSLIFLSNGSRQQVIWYTQVDSKPMALYFQYTSIIISEYSDFPVFMISLFCLEQFLFSRAFLFHFKLLQRSMHCGFHELLLFLFFLSSRCATIVQSYIGSCTSN